MASACLNASLGFLSLTLLFTLTPSTSQALTETTERRGRVAGASHVNLRSGPGISYPPVTIIKNGEEVNVEKLEGNWYRISLPDGSRGYVYAELIHILPEKSEQELSVAPTTPPTPIIEVSLEDPTPKPQPETVSPEPIKEPLEDSTQKPEPDTVSPEPMVEQPVEVLPTPIVVAQAVVPVEKTPVSPPEIESSPPKTEAVVPRKIDTTVPVNWSHGRVWGIVSWITVPSCIFVLGWILGGNYYLRRDRIERTKLRF